MKNETFIIKPHNLKKQKLKSDSALVKQAIDLFNVSIINKNYDKGYEENNGYYVIETGMHGFSSVSVMEEAISQLKEAGWIVWHGDHYSMRGACPSYAIFVSSEQLDSAWE